MNLLTWIVENKAKRIDIAGFGNYSIEAVAGLILEGKADKSSYGYLTDCLREKMCESSLALVTNT